MAESAKSPICWLPIEILTEIFQWHCEECSLFIEAFLWNEKTEQYDRCKASTPTLDVAQTCSLWQNIAISRPTLWSRVDVDLNCGSQSFVDLVTLYLSRSKTASLSLILRAEGEGTRYSVDLKESGQSMLKALVMENYRWEWVEFDMTMAALGQYSTPVTSGDCENLEVLLIPCESDLAYSHEVQVFSRVVGYTPMLHTLMFNGVWETGLITRNSLPFAQLLDIDIEGKEVNLTQLQDLLDRCVALKHLYVIPEFDHHPILPIPPSRVGLSHCQNLEELFVDVSDRNESPCNGIIASAYFFQILRAPALRYLWLEGQNDDAEERSACFDSVKKFLHVSECQLDRLQLTGDLLDTDMVLQLFELLPTLTELEISKGRDRLRLFDALTIPHQPLGSDSQPVNQTQSRKVLLPKLTSLAFEITLEDEELVSEKPVSLSQAQVDSEDEDEWMELQTTDSQDTLQDLEEGSKDNENENEGEGIIAVHNIQNIQEMTVKSLTVDFQQVDRSNDLEMQEQETAPKTCQLAMEDVEVEEQEQDHGTDNQDTVANHGAGEPQSTGNGPRLDDKIEEFGTQTGGVDPHEDSAVVKSSDFEMQGEEMSTKTYQVITEGKEVDREPEPDAETNDLGAIKPGTGESPRQSTDNGPRPDDVEMRTQMDNVDAHQDSLEEDKKSLTSEFQVDQSNSAERCSPLSEAGVDGVQLSGYPSDTIRTMLCSRRNSSDSNVRILERFTFSVHRGTAPSTEPVVKWFDKFCTTTAPQLRTLAGKGLKLELDVQA
ncbi:hypothetical protein D9758_006422 [Tetrapyrgos nigripes]|uniref:F-box domain-containing protein n=1 Tax=Tetrapyrgos nigripes TaxID=182062 RepID=A0A8H5G077_9AGAR|nr:hypothetical protein D9758_006422 [Tetrapyrgos nigripes]